MYELLYILYAGWKRIIEKRNFTGDRKNQEGKRK